MKNKKQYNSKLIADSFCKELERFFQSEGAKIYVVDSNIYYLDWNNCVWNIYNKKELWELFLSVKPDLPKRCALTYICPALRRSIKRSKLLPRIVVNCDPLTHQHVNKKHEKVEAIGLWINDLIYPARMPAFQKQRSNEK